MKLLFYKKNLFLYGYIIWVYIKLLNPIKFIIMITQIRGKLFVIFFFLQQKNIQIIIQ